MKKLLSALLVASMTLALMACSSSASSDTSGADSASTGEADSQTEVNDTAGSDAPVRISWWGTQVVHEYTLEVCEKFTEKTNIPLEAEYAAWADYWQKMGTLSAAGDLPDIMRQDYSYINQYASKDLLEPLDEYIESGAIDCSNVDPMLLEGGRINGKIYGINIGSNAFALIYDKEMIEEAGMKAPGTEMSWQDYENFCLEFAQKTGKFGGTIAELRDQFIIEFMLRARNESLFDSENATLGYASDDVVIGYFDSVKRMQDAGAIPSVDTIAQQTSYEDSPFSLGEAATIITFTDVYPTLCQVKGKTLGLTIVPGTGSEKVMYSKPSQFFSIPANSEHKEEAAAFINAWINDQDLNDILKGRRGVPISSVVAENVAQQMSDAERIVFEYMGELAQYSKPINAPYPSGASEVTNELKTQFEMVLYGESDSAKAAADLRTKATEYLAAANQ